MCRTKLVTCFVVKFMPWDVGPGTWLEDCNQDDI